MKLQLTLPWMGRLRRRRFGVAVDGDFTLGCTNFKVPRRSLSEAGQMSLEVREVVQPGTILGESSSVHGA